MSLSVKITLQSRNQHVRGNTNDAYEFVEARRFSIEEDVASNYEYFRAKVVSVMSSLKTKAFRLYWKDNEDDMVVFSSDEELIEALSHVLNSGECLFRVYIREVDDITPTPTTRCRSSVPVFSGCGNVFGLPPLHLLLGGYRSACGGQRGAACCDGHSQTGSHRCGDRRRADAAAENKSSSTESQHRTDGHDGSAGDGNGKKMGAAEAGCSKNDCSVGASGDDEQRLASDFITNVLGGIGSLLTTLGVPNMHSQRPDDIGQQTQFSTKQTPDVTSAGAGAANGKEGIPNGEQRPSDGTLSDGLIQVVETLKEMGFKDEDGSLSRLVATHSGHIERIIHFMETCRESC